MRTGRPARPRPLRAEEPHGAAARPTAPSHPQDVHFPPVSRNFPAGLGERGGGNLRAGAPMR